MWERDLDCQARWQILHDPDCQFGRDASPIEGDWRITPEELFHAARAAEGAAGPDGWSAAEVNHLPRTAWAIFRILWERWTERNQYPIAWRHIRISMIPKVNHDGHIEASDMRPISVQSVFSRLLSTVIATRQSTSNWILQHAPAFSHDGIPGRGPGTALLPLEQAFAKGGILVALDLSKAFDRVQPLIALHRLRQAGMHP